LTKQNSADCAAWVESLNTRDDGQGKVQGGSNMTGTDLCVNKPHCAAAMRP